LCFSKIPLNATTLGIYGADGRNRTDDLLITSELKDILSYTDES